ncbi:hypothetical protein Lal_00000897 [Lupinus albus]|nr:hypothetical protein Lal_00000897 [Lupinus albus]
MVDIISTSSIKAESDVYGDSSSPKIIHSTPWDLTCLPFETDRKGLIYNNPMNIEHQIQHLKQSLSSTLAFFPPLDGRLVILQHDEDNTVSSHILCNNACALFVHAVVSDNTGVKNYESTSHPLLAVQITELVDGIFIGFSMNHSVLDDILKDSRLSERSLAQARVSAFLPGFSLEFSLERGLALLGERDTQEAVDFSLERESARLGDRGTLEAVEFSLERESLARARAPEFETLKGRDFSLGRRVLAWARI